MSLIPPWTGTLVDAYACVHNAVSLVLKLHLLVYDTGPLKLLNTCPLFLEEQRNKGKAFIRSAHTPWSEPSPAFVPLTLPAATEESRCVRCVLSLSVHTWPFRNCCEGNLSTGKKAITGVWKVLFCAEGWSLMAGPVIVLELALPSVCHVTVQLCNSLVSSWCVRWR